MAELTLQNDNAHHVQIGDTDYEIESVYGNKPLDEILAAYICEKIKGDQTIDKAA